MKCLGCYRVVDEAIGKKFEQYGGFVARHPWKFIIGYVLVMGLLGIGLINLKSENDVERVFTPKNSEASQNRELLRGYFKDLSGSNFYTQSQLTAGQYGDIIFKTKNGQNILNSTFLREVETIFNSVKNFQFTNTSGERATYHDVCAVRSSDCYISGSNVFSPAFNASVQANNIPYPIANGVSISGVFGNIQASGGRLHYASSFRLRFYLRTDTADKTASGDLWVKAFLEHVKTLSPTTIDIAYAHSNSLSEELNSNIGGDIVFFSLTFTLMCVYASFAVANFRCLSDRQNLAKAAVLGTALAILGALGFVCACGVEFVSIVGVMPFLIIGIGVDDMFLLLSGLADTYDEKGLMEPEERVKKTMRSSGVGITITSLTDLIAFMVGIASPFLGVRNFCIFTTMAVLFCYISYVTFFLGCITLNERRVMNGQHCMTCRSIKQPEVGNNLKRQPHSFMCTGTVPEKRSDVEGPLEKYPPMLLSKVVLWTPVKVFIIVIFMVYLGISIWGATQFQQGLLLSNLVNEESYYFKYSNFNDEFADDGFPISFNIIADVVYSDEQTWLAIQKLENTAKQDQYIHATSRINWLSEYRQSSSFNNASESNFIQNLRSIFLPANPSFMNDIAFNEANTSITASRIYVFADNVPDSTQEGKLMLRMRDVASASGFFKVVAYAPAFIFFEQYVAILPNTLQTLGISIAAIFVVTAIFLPHPVLVFFVTVSLTMIIVGMLGFMHFWDLTLSSVTMTHIIMSVGFSVDFSAHICHGFMETAATNRNEGARGALKRSGGAIFNGAVSSIVGIIMLVFSKSFIFFSFFKVMLLIILFGAAHALFFLPVVLSLIGPKFDFPQVSSDFDLKKKSEVTDSNNMSHSNKAFDY